MGLAELAPVRLTEAPMTSELLLLFAEFFKIGLFAFGGGMATVPFLFELTERYDWFTAEELADMIAVSEATPGPIGINMSTYCGLKTAGISGGLVATFALVLPSFAVLYAVSGLSHWTGNRVVRSVLTGLRAVTVTLLLSALLRIFLLTFAPGPHMFFDIVLFAVVFAGALFLKKLPSVAFVLFSGVAAFAAGYFF